MRNMREDPVIVILQILTAVAFVVLLGTFGWFLKLAFDGSFQRYAQHMGW
jgi:hypothetical protein